ncbi:MAG: hypothetical protein LBB42_02895, partial [Coriobacteriales bacterium]|nr:hypothetical protein [Coriobacteriales bacterium]
SLSLSLSDPKVSPKENSPSKTQSRPAVSPAKRALALVVAFVLACGSFAAAPAAAFADEGTQEIKPLAGDVVYVKNVTELKNAANSAPNSTPRTIVMTENITFGTESLVENYLLVGSNKDITLTGSFTLSSPKLYTVYIQTGGKFTLNGPTLTFTSTTGSCVSNSGIFTLKSGKIANCKSTSVKNSNTFTMQGGSIMGNNTTSTGGTVWNTGGSVFTMSGGSISNNTDTYGGGGVNVATRGTFNLKGGTISNNKSGGYGGGVSSSGTFAMSGGTIANNVSSESGGGVYDAGSFTMSGGTISGNVANGNGGGVETTCFSDGFKMTGGTVSGNTAKGNGGGISCDNKPVSLTGGTVSGNTAKGNGGGLHANRWNYDCLTIGKNVTFSKNKAKDARKLNPKYMQDYNKAKIACTTWTYPFMQGFNNYDVSNKDGIKTKAKVTKKPTIKGSATITLKKGYKKTIKLYTVNGGADCKWSVKKGKTKVKIDQSGQLIIPKGLKKGKYKITISAKNVKGTTKKKVTIVVK